MDQDNFDSVRSGKKRNWTTDDLHIPIGVGENINYSFEGPSLILNCEGFIDLVESNLKQISEIATRVDSSFSFFSMSLAMGLNAPKLEGYRAPEFRKQHIIKLRMDEVEDGTQLYLGHPDLPGTPLVMVDSEFRNAFTEEMLQRIISLTSELTDEFDSFKDNLKKYCSGIGLEEFDFFLYVSLESYKDSIAN